MLVMTTTMTKAAIVMITYSTNHNESDDNSINNNNINYNSYGMNYMIYSYILFCNLFLIK